MTVTIVDEEGSREVDMQYDNVMCPNCYATNDSWRRTCRNCGKRLEMKKCQN